MKCCEMLLASLFHHRLFLSLLMLNQIPVWIYALPLSLTPCFPHASWFLRIPVLLICYSLTTPNLFHSLLTAAAWLLAALCPGTRCFQEDERTTLEQSSESSRAMLYPYDTSCFAGFSFHPVLNKKPIIIFLPEVRCSIFNSPSTKADPVSTYWVGFNSLVSFPLQAGQLQGLPGHSYSPTGQDGPSGHTPFLRALRVKSRCPGTTSRLLLACSTLPVQGIGGREGSRT